MRKKVVWILIIVMLTILLVACGGNESSGEGDTLATESVEETVTAADPLSDGGRQSDDSDGCIEDSDDLLY